ncbi:IS256 family transposase (plasmid) [Sinorhizobium meliloti]|nr:transposase [Sinorhizobium meliloti]ASP89624.1 IS256 family transposase [Sinorhizobium meliloti]
MTKTEGKTASAAVKDILLSNPDGLREVIRTVMQEVLEAEMDEALGAAKGERTPERLGYRSGHYGRTLITRVGKLELRVPQDRSGHFSTELFERYQRSERALVATLAEMYVQGVSTRKVKAITEELCGHAFSASSISAINKRQILSVEMAGRESRSAWKDFLVRLKGRGLKGVELVVSDDHAGLVAAIGEVIPEAAWQRCYVHFLRNALDHLPRKHGDDCLQELRWLYDRRDLDEAKADLAAWLGKWSVRYPRLTSWVEETIEQTLTFFRLPRQHHKHLKSTNMLERLNEEIRRRTYVVRIFPNTESCLRLVRALAVETHENWMEANRYINMDDLREHKKLALRQAA